MLRTAVVLVFILAFSLAEMTTFPAEDANFWGRELTAAMSTSMSQPSKGSKGGKGGSKGGKGGPKGGKGGPKSGDDDDDDDGSKGGDDDDDDDGSKGGDDDDDDGSKGGDDDDDDDGSKGGGDDDDDDGSKGGGDDDDDDDGSKGSSKGSKGSSKGSKGSSKGRSADPSSETLENDEEFGRWLWYYFMELFGRDGRRNLRLAEEAAIIEVRPCAMMFHILCVLCFSLSIGTVQ